MATTSKSITNNFHKYKEKGNRRTAGLLNLQQRSSASNSSGSVPKRYRSVYTEGTPLASFGIRNHDNSLRSHSPPIQMHSQHHQRPLEPTKEFLTTPAIAMQQHDRRDSLSQTNGYHRSQTDITIQNVNVALAKTLNTLRQESINPTATNAYATSTTVRPMTARGKSPYKTNSNLTSNFHYQLSSGTRAPLPAELISKRSMTSIPSTDPSNGTGPPSGQRSIPSPAHNEMKSTDFSNPHVSTPFRLPTKSFDTGLHQVNGFDFETVTIEEYPDKFRKPRFESSSQLTTKPTSATRADSQHRPLPEVSVNPHVQGTLQRKSEHFIPLYEPMSNGLSNKQYRSDSYEKSSTNAHHRHHHIQVEPTDTFKRTSSPIRHLNIADVQPNRIVQHQRSSLGTNSILISTANPLNEPYIERENTGTHLLNTVNTHAMNTNNNDSTPTFKQYENLRERKQNRMTPPPSPTNQELNHIWKKPRPKYSFRSLAINGSMRRPSKTRRPPGRLKNYGDESDTETTATETQSKDGDMTRRNGLPPSDLGSDAWSDLTSEFSDTKFRKHPNIRTSTPNMTRQSSSQSSKEVGQIRKQLTDLQIMYNDLLKLLDVDIESVRSSHKSSTSSHTEHHSRRHRFRKVMPVTSARHSNIDMKEVNQRFTRLESSVVTLAESIAKLSAQIQMQRVLKDDVQLLRQEVAELRQQMHHEQPRHTLSNNFGTIGLPSLTSQQPTRVITPNTQRLPTVHSNSPLNISTSYPPSTPTIQRASSIIDPRQARKIEQFFGIEAMLRYFLSLLNYEEYAPVLEREKIGIYELPYVSERKLQSLGIPYGPCARIIYEAQQYFISLLTLKSTGIDV